jgi:hypothetical protein
VPLALLTRTDEAIEQNCCLAAARDAAYGTKHQFVAALRCVSCRRKTRRSAATAILLLDLKWVYFFCGREVIAALIHDLGRGHLVD